MQTQRLTKYPPASLRELFSISFPLMLSALSGALMFVLDRLIVSRLSIDAMNAVVVAGMPCYIFHFGVIGIASIAEVFVGRYNGAKQYSKLAEPVWQMIWFCLLSFIMFIPLALYAGTYFIEPQYQELGLGYYKYFMGFGPLFALIPAIGSFFIGQGKVKIVMFSIAFGNILNLILDLLLVFGLPGYIPRLEVQGAAVATVISQAVIILILFSIFLSKNNREKYGSLNFKLRIKEFIECLKIGGPNAMGHMFEIAVWTALLSMMAKVSAEHVTIFSIGQSFFVLFVFITEGLKKGVMTVCSNLIGAGQNNKLNQVLFSAIKLLLGFSLAIGLPLLVYPDLIASLFLDTKFDAGDLDKILDLAKTSFFWIWLFFVLDCLGWVFAGMAAAMKDTLFIMWACVINLLLFSLLPVYYFVYINKAGPIAVWEIVCIYGLANIVIFALRYKSQAVK